MKILNSVWVLLIMVGMASCGGSGSNSPSETEAEEAMTVQAKIEKDLTLYGASYKLNMENSSTATTMVLTNDTGEVLNIQISLDTLRNMFLASKHFDHSFENAPSAYSFEGFDYVTHRGRYMIIETTLSDPQSKAKDYVGLQVEYLKTPGLKELFSIGKKPLKR